MKVGTATTNGVKVRKATASDLDAVHQLIRSSFAAMIPHSILPSSFWNSGAEKLIDSELSQTQFGTAYNTNDKNCFWVAEDSVDGVIGCVGIKSCSNTDEVELVRMGR